MIKITHTARGNHRYRYGFRDRAGEFQIKTLFGAVAVHTREQNLTGAESRHLLGPLNSIEPGRRPSPVREDLPTFARVSSCRASERQWPPQLHCDPCRAADSPIKSGLLTPAVLIEILSAPAFKGDGYRKLCAHRRQR